MILFRLSAYLLALLGFCLFVIDGARSIAAGELMLTSFGPTWDAIGPGSLAAAEEAITSYAAGFLWDPLMVGILALPSFAVVLGTAFLLILADTALGRSWSRLPRRPLRA